MSVFMKATAVALPLMVIAGLACLGPAAAQQAEQCTGTLCDLYYRNAPAPAAPSASAPAQAVAAGVPAGATPMTVPSGNFFTGLFSRSDPQQAAVGGSTGAQQPAQAQSSSFLPGVHMGGGGLLGDHSQPQCEGTICDLMGRSTPPREQAPSASEQVAAGSTSAAAAAPASGVSYAPTKHYDPIEEKPRCHNASDPWHCYR